MKAGFISQGMLLMAMPMTTNLLGQPAVSPQQISDTIYLTESKEKIDTGSYRLSTSDSLLALKNDIAEEAPKIKLNPKAVTFVNHYLKTENESLVKIRKRSSNHFRIIENVLQKNNLPLELKYLAVIESELKSNALSRVGAKGPWQLMPTTARLLGLKVSKQIDERTHYYKSTVAVAKYLKDLYAEFGDWLLVIAAYNGGPGTVYKAIKKSGSRNFWYLQYHLPMETRAHVKRFIGAHYFFEEEGSETTLTKTEVLAYRKALTEYHAAQMRTINETNDLTPSTDALPTTKLDNTKPQILADRNKVVSVMK